MGAPDKLNRFEEEPSPQPPQRNCSKQAGNRCIVATLGALVLVLLITVIVLQVLTFKDVNDCTSFSDAEKVQLLAKLSGVSSSAAKPNTWVKVEPIGSQPTPRLAHAACAYAEEMYIHGGLYGSNDQTLGDFWKYNEAADEWTQLASSGETPSPRLHHTLVATDDGMLYLFGGFNYFQTVATHDSFSDFYKYNTKTGVWTRLDTTNTGVAPTKRGAHEMIYANNALYMFGGFDQISSVGHKAELWKYDLASNTWTDLTSTTNAMPPGRIGFSFTSTGNAAFLFGGSCTSGSTDGEENGQCNDSWMYEWNTNKWTELNPKNPPAHRRATNADVAVHGIVYLFGGVYIGGGTVKFFDDVHAYDPKSNTWMVLFPNYGRGDAPPPTFGHSVVRLNNKVVVFGGRVSVPSSPGSNQLWEYETLAPL